MAKAQAPEGSRGADGEDGDAGTVQRVSTQLGYGVESVRTWVKTTRPDPASARHRPVKREHHDGAEQALGHGSDVRADLGRRRLRV